MAAALRAGPVIDRSGVARAASVPASGNAAAWGSDSGNQLGDLPCCGSGGAGNPIPQAVPIPPTVIQLSGTDKSAAALHPDGTVSAWGTSVYGATGLGYNNGYAMFAPGEVGVSGVISIAAGLDHTLYLTTAGLYATGDNYQNDLGQPGCCGYYRTPVLAPITGVQAIAAGGHDSYALKTDGTVWGFGDNANGGLGTGNTTQSTVPLQIPGLSSVVAVGAGRFAAYAVKSDGTVWSWGSNYLGALGHGTLTQGGAPSSPAQITGLSNVVSLFTGPNSTAAYAIKSDGTLWAWGANDRGQLANGTTNSSGTPAQVGGISNVVSVAASTATVALRDDGAAFAWGDNTYGQVGNGAVAGFTGGYQLTPTRVLTLTGVAAVGATTQTSTASANIVDPGPLPSYYGGADGTNPSGLADACIQALCADPVNTATGATVEYYDDLKIPGRGVPLDFQRTYGSDHVTADGRLGYGWSDSYGLSLSVDGGTGVVTVNQENASQVQFTPSGSTYTVPAFIAASLTHNGDGTWTMTRKAREKFTFDATGRLTAESDLNGYQTTIAYPNSTTQVITDPAGRTFTLTLSSGHVTKLVDSSSAARTVLYAYNDGNGNLTDVTDAVGGVTHFTYDAGHRLTTIRTPRYAGDTTTTPTPITTNVYDGTGRLTSQTDPLGRQTTFDYTSISESTMVTDPKGNVTVDRYHNGRRVASTRGYGTSSAATSKYYYDPDTSAGIATCDPLGHCQATSYDAAGNILQRSDQLGRTTTHTYDALGDVLTTTDPKGVKTTMTYDATGNLLTRSRPLLDASGATIATQLVTYNYGGTTPVYAGDVTSMVDANGKTWQLRYDAYGNQVSKTAPPTPENSSGNKTTWTYDTGAGWKTSMVSPRGNTTGGTPSQFTTTYAHDALGRLTKVQDPLYVAGSPLLHQHTSHYDADGNLDYEIDGNGNKTLYAYDAAEQPIKTTMPDATYTSKDYFGDGSVQHSISARGKTTSFTYDPLGHMKTRTEANGHVMSYTYDVAGRLTQKAPGGSNCNSGPWTGCATYTYDSAGELTGASYSDGVTTNVSSITYDGDGQRTGMTDATGTSVWMWDSLNRLTSTTDGNGQTVTYGYDLAGNKTSVTYPGSNTVTRDFDAAGRMDWLQDYKSNKSTFTYDPDSNLVKTTEPAAAGVTDTNTYDNAGQKLTMTTAKGASNLAKFVYTRNGAEQPLTSTTTGITDPTQAYAYNTLQQLTKSGTTAAPVTYGYDADGGVTARNNAMTQAYDDAGELCWQKAAVVATPSCGTVPSGATTFTFDGSGNRTKKTPGTGSAVTYAYDAEGNLVNYNAGAATYKYDGTGLRLSKTVSGVTQKLVWDRTSATEPALLADAANKYVYGPDGLPFEQITTSGTVTYLHHDQLGSTRLLTSTAGANVGSYSFDPYGSLATHTGTLVSPLQFAGQYTDSESGLLYLRARYYDPATAQFLTLDPLVSVTNQPYQYAGDDPTWLTDPSGLYGVPGLDQLGSLIDSGVAKARDAANAAVSAAVEHKTEIGIALGAISLATGIGEAAITVAGVAELGVGATTLGVASMATGVGAVALDGAACAQGEQTACIGAVLAAPSALPYFFPEAGLIGRVLIRNIAIGLGGTGLALDAGAALSSAAEWCR